MLWFTVAHFDNIDILLVMRSLFNLSWYRTSVYKVLNSFKAYASFFCLLKVMQENQQVVYSDKTFVYDNTFCCIVNINSWMKWFSQSRPMDGMSLNKGHVNRPLSTVSIRKSPSLLRNPFSILHTRSKSEMNPVSWISNSQKLDHQKLSFNVVFIGSLLLFKECFWMSGDGQSQVALCMLTMWF